MAFRSKKLANNFSSEKFADNLFSVSKWWLEFIRNVFVFAGLVAVAHLTQHQLISVLADLTWIALITFLLIPSLRHLDTLSRKLPPSGRWRIPTIAIVIAVAYYICWRLGQATEDAVQRLMAATVKR